MVVQHLHILSLVEVLMLLLLVLIILVEHLNVLLYSFTLNAHVIHAFIPWRIVFLFKANRSHIKVFSHSWGFLLWSFIFQLFLDLNLFLLMEYNLLRFGLLLIHKLFNLITKIRHRLIRIWWFPFRYRILRNGRNEWLLTHDVSCWLSPWRNNGRHSLIALIKVIGRLLLEKVFSHGRNRSYFRVTFLHGRLSKPFFVPQHTLKQRIRSHLPNLLLPVRFMVILLIISLILMRWSDILIRSKRRCSLFVIYHTIQRSSVIWIIISHAWIHIWGNWQRF